MRSTLTLIAAPVLALAALGCGAQGPTPTAAAPAVTPTLAPTSTSPAVPPTPTPVPTATPTPQGPPSAELYMATACRVLGEIPSEPLGPGPLEQDRAMLQEMSPPDELQDYHATLVEMLAFGIRTFDATPGLHLEAEMIGETVMEGLTFRDGWLDEGGTGERLTRQEYLEASPGFLGADLEFDEDPSHDVLEAITSNLVERAGRVVPPAELIEYHDLLIAYLVLTHESVLAARQQEQDPDDP